MFLAEGACRAGKQNASNVYQGNQDGVIIAVLESGTLRWNRAGTETGTAAGLLGGETSCLGELMILATPKCFRLRVSLMFANANETWLMAYG